MILERKPEGDRKVMLIVVIYITSGSPKTFNVRVTCLSSIINFFFFFYFHLFIFFFVNGEMASQILEEVHIRQLLSETFTMYIQVYYIFLYGKGNFLSSNLWFISIRKNNFSQWRVKGTSGSKSNSITLNQSW